MCPRGRIGFISSKSRRAELGQDPVKQSLLVTRYDPVRASKDECLRLEDIKELLGLQVTERGARGMQLIG